ncbi:hypothetical protein A9Q84_14290 [Halobacteriovorax marinus]|uniref:HTH araC/xylS-type domain-containing protein n=1 Tax=Halobacteriovorax marinus TaxID=97084 RepID=A0A1Y5F4T0_9BACT|nr:hypothetical protein A9Q84_14290 [Halobacteriovorax marinus]
MLSCAQPIDILGDVLRVGELGSQIVARPNLVAPWGMMFPTEDKSLFHIFKSGTCYFYPDLESKEPRVIQAGDLLFIPRINNYRLLSEKDGESNFYKDVVKSFKDVVIKESDKATTMICGSYKLKTKLSLPFFSLFPDFIHLSKEDLENYPELGNTVKLIMQEEAVTSLGADIILLRIVDILLVQMIRYWLTNYDSKSVGWLMATLDSEVGQVLSMIHRNPEKKWTVEDLAEEAAVSRTKLFNSFTKSVGVSPIQYLTSWRIDLSKKLLTTTNQSIVEVANSVGYESEAAFSRAFKKTVEMTPGKYRKSVLD